MRHNKHVTATRPLQHNFAAAFRITPNAGCVPGTGAARDRTRQDRTGQDRTGRDRAHGTAREVRRRKRQKSGGKSHGNSAGAAGAAERTTAGTAVGAEREQCKTSRNSRKNNARNSGGARQKQQRGKTGTAAEATAGRTEEGKLQRKIRSSTYNPEAAFAKNFNNKAAIKSQPKSKNPVTNKTQNEPPKAGLSATRRRKEKNPADTGCKKVTRREQFDNKFIYL